MGDGIRIIDRLARQIAGLLPLRILYFAVVRARQIAEAERDSTTWQGPIVASAILGALHVKMRDRPQRQPLIYWIGLAAALAFVALIVIAALSGCGKDDTETITKSTVEAMCPGITVNLILALPLLLGTVYSRGRGTASFTEDRLACPECGSHAVGREGEVEDTGQVEYKCYLCGHVWQAGAAEVEGD
jgi:predicted RNA-binding Zn-ribbon protein involved in translation (DUF1610 family)